MEDLDVVRQLKRAGDDASELLFVQLELLTKEMGGKILVAVGSFGSRDHLAIVLEPG